MEAFFSNDMFQFGGALIAVLFSLLTVSELWEIPVALFLSERFGMIVNLFVCLFITVCGVVISQTRIWYVLVSAIPMRMMCPLLHVLPNGLAAEAGNPLLIRESLSGMSLNHAVCFCNGSVFEMVERRGGEIR